MARKKTEQVYTIPLRKDIRAQRSVRRAPVCVRAVRNFLIRHTKAEVKLSTGVNEFLWVHGAQHPPGSVKVAVEVKDTVAFARLPEEKDSRKADAAKAGKGKKTTSDDEKASATDAAKPEGQASGTGENVTQQGAPGAEVSAAAAQKTANETK